MKKYPLYAQIAAVACLSMSITYSALQLLKPAQRPIALPVPQAPAEASLEAAQGLFGGQAAATASIYQLRGVIAAKGAASAAIIATDGKPARAVGQGHEVEPGVIVQEVQAGYVLLSAGGAIKRLELARAAEGGHAGATAATAAP